MHTTHSGNLSSAGTCYVAGIWRKQFQQCYPQLLFVSVHSYAESLASTRILKHSVESSRGSCGENLAWASYDQSGTYIYIYMHTHSCNIYLSMTYQICVCAHIVKSNKTYNNFVHGA